MSQTRTSQFSKQKETAKIKRKQTSIDTFCEKKDCHMFDDEEIFLNLRKKEETARPVRRPRKYDSSISVNELHNFNDLVEFDKWYNQKSHEKYLVLKKEEEIKRFYLACRNYRETARAFQLQDSTVRKICKAAPPEKSESHQGFKGGKAWKENVKGSRRPLSDPPSIDEELLSWLLIMNDLHLPVSILALQKRQNH